MQLTINVMSYSEKNGENKMKFEEAAREMEKGHKIRNTKWAKGKYLHSINGYILDDEMSHVMVTVGEITRQEWEVVDEWNLSKHGTNVKGRLYTSYTMFQDIDVQCCKEEILKDLYCKTELMKGYNGILYKVIEIDDITHIINKRFGDIK